MEIFLRKHLSDLFKESFNKGVDSLLGWVEGSVVSGLLSAGIVTLCEEAGLTGLE